ncbi:MAG: flagellar filament capping protein FliD [Proteobacteria bacterium]|nr:flagellar filament capping protein FliD [Pseudomonadota bacterium]
MGIRSMPGATTGLFDPKIVEGLIEVEKIPIESAKKRKEAVTTERDEFKKLVDLVGGLDTSLNRLKTKTDFYKMKLESSHPDILDGVISGATLPGNFEFEVRGLAKSEKQLAYGFPDKDKTPVGFGYMVIERENEDDLDITIDPGSTLKDVAERINEADGGIRAMVINTKYQPDSFRLLVLSEKSGKESRIHIDEDTTFLEFKEQVAGRNLDVLFEDVPVTDETNDLKELVDGVVFNVKRSEPGTRIQVNINYDIDKTVESIADFVKKYNDVDKFINNQFIVDDKTGRGGVLAADGTIKTIMRTLRNGINDSLQNTGKFRTLADIGITTNPKTGELDYKEAKVKQALAEDYEGVAKIFIRTKDSFGIAARLAEQIKGLRDAQNGILKSRTRALESIIKDQDSGIAKKEAQMARKEDTIKRRFSNLESQLSGMKAQGDFLAQRLAAEKQQ